MSCRPIAQQALDLRAETFDLGAEVEQFLALAATAFHACLEVVLFLHHALLHGGIDQCAAFVINHFDWRRCRAVWRHMVASIGLENFCPQLPDECTPLALQF